MKCLRLILIVGVLALLTPPDSGTAESLASPWRLLPGKPQMVFGGGEDRVSMVWSNASQRTISGDLRARIWQTSSATGLLWAERDWTRLAILPRQAALESAGLPFPSVASETRFLVQWVLGAEIVGSSEIRVFPTNLLTELKTLAGGNAVGILDPEGILGPLLAKASIARRPLADSELDAYDGRVAILGFFNREPDWDNGLPERVARLAKKGAAVVWICPRSGRGSGLRPNFYSVAVGRGAVVVAEPELVSPLAQSPAAQLNLVHLVEIACRAELPTLPGFTR